MHDASCRRDPGLYDGRKAHDCGYRQDQCPHPPGSNHAAEWQRLWLEGQTADRRRQARVYGALCVTR